MVISLDSAGVIIASIGGVSAIVWEYFRVILKLENGIRDSADSIRKEISDNQEKLNVVLKEQGDRISILELNLTNANAKMGMFWSAVGGVMSSLIKQPIHARKDELMDKLVPEDLSDLPTCNDEELMELRGILNDELTTLRQIKEPRSLAYALAIGYIDQLLFDRGHFRRGAKL